MKPYRSAVNLLMLSLFLATVLISLIPQSARAANSDPTQDMKRRQLYTFGKCLGTDVINTGHDISTYGDMFKNNADTKEIIVVGMDRDSGNGVMSCHTVIDQGSIALHPELASLSSDQRDDWFMKTLTGKTLTESNLQPISHNGMEDRRKALAAEVLNAEHSVASPNDALRQARYFPLAGICYDVKDHPDSSRQFNNRTDFVTADKKIYAYLRKNSDILNSVASKIPEIKKNNGNLSGGHVTLGDIELGWNWPGSITLPGAAGQFDGYSSDFYPIGSDVGETGSASPPYTKDAIVDCQFVDRYKEIIFAGYHADSSGNIVDNNGNTVATAPNDGGTNANTQDPCGSLKGVFNYIVCPILQGVDDLISNAFSPGGILFKELSVSPLDVSSNTQGQGNIGDSLSQIWGFMRNLTNLFFVVIFLVMVFANTLSIDIDAYTVKKVLPRLIAAAILVQFSFVVCSLVVDLGNILGQGLPTLMPGIQGIQGASTVQKVTSGFVGVAVLGGAAAIVTGLGAWLLILPLGIAFLVGILSVIFTLILRHFIIQVLVLVSPLALASWVLPNTEKFFKLWWTNFVKLVMMYPLIMLLLTFASLIKLANPTDILSLVAPIIVFFMIPATFKASGTLMAAGSKFVSGRTGAAGGYLGKKVKEGEGYKNAQLNAASKRLSAMNRVASFGQGNTGRLGGVQRRLGKLGARGVAIGTGQPFAATSAIARQRELNTELKSYGDQLDLSSANSPDELSAIIGGNEQWLRDNGREDLVPFARNTVARLAAMKKKGENVGLDTTDVAAINSMNVNNATKQRYWSTVNSGAVFGKTAGQNRRLATGSFKEDGFKLGNIDDAKAKLSREYVATLATGSLVDQLKHDGVLDDAMAASVLADTRLAGRMNDEVKAKLEAITTGTYTGAAVPEDADGNPSLRGTAGATFDQRSKNIREAEASVPWVT